VKSWHTGSRDFSVVCGIDHGCGGSGAAHTINDTAILGCAVLTPHDKLSLGQPFLRSRPERHRVSNSRIDRAKALAARS
jgi:hypothetical protein